MSTSFHNNLQQRPGSCDIGMPPAKKLDDGTDKIEDIPGAMMHKMKKYAANLRKKHPKMKPDRVKELTAKKFNIKLV